MSDDWNKMRHSLPDDPAVLGIAARTKLDRYSVVGRLHVLWSWADQHTTDGYIPNADPAFVDEKVGRKGFAAAMADPAIAWLVIEPAGLRLPNFTRHNGQSAKARALDNRRQTENRRNKNQNLSGSEPDEKTKTVTPPAGQASGFEPDETRTRVRERERIPPPPPAPARRLLSDFDFPELAALYPGVDIRAEARHARQKQRTKTGNPLAEIEFEWFRDSWLKHSPASTARSSASDTDPEPCPRSQWLPLLDGTVYGPGGLQEDRAASWSALPLDARNFVRNQLSAVSPTP